MANFKADLPNELIKQFEELGIKAEEMMSEMTRAGAEKARQRVLRNMPDSWKDSNIRKCIKLTKTYRTPSDDGINTKVVIAGYFTNKRGVKTPAPLVANVTEYGSNGQAKKPFFRRSFKKAEIEQAMQEVENKYLGGLE